MKKIAAIGFIVLVIVVGFGAYRLLSNLDAIVAAAIEKHGSEATGTRVHVSGVEISLRDGKGSVRGLRIANPDGFEASEIFLLEDVTLDLDVASVKDDPVILEEVRIRTPVVLVEFSADGAMNIERMRQRLQAAAGERGDDASRSGAKKVRIKHFVFEAGRVELDATALGIDARSLELPEIRLEDIGGAQGLSPDEVARTILETVVKRTASQIAQSEASRLIKDKLGESLSDKAKSLIGKIDK